MLVREFANKDAGSFGKVGKIVMKHWKESINFKIMCISFSRIQLIGMKYASQVTAPVLSLLSLFLLWRCQQPVDYSRLSAFADSGQLQAVIEIPSGSSLEVAFNQRTGEFEPGDGGEAERVINFLPYPGNYGFIPGTVTPGAGNDGEARPLNVLVIGRQQTTGTVLEVVPLGMLLLKSGSVLEPQVIAVPVDEDLQTVKAGNFLDFLIQHDAAKKMIEDWFANHRGWGRVQVMGWEDDQYARKEINKWKKS